MIKIVLILLIAVTILGCQKTMNSTSQEEVKKKISFNEYGAEIAKTHHLNLLFTDNFTAKEKAFCLACTSNKLLTLQEGQILLRQVVADFLASLRQMDATREVVIEDIAIRITFFDEQVNRIPRPFLGQILLVDTMCYYYQKDEETPQLRLILKEKY